jgi:hypothetical protein
MKQQARRVGRELFGWLKMGQEQSSPQEQQILGHANDRLPLGELDTAAVVCLLMHHGLPADGDGLQRVKLGGWNGETLKLDLDWTVACVSKALTGGDAIKANQLLRHLRRWAKEGVRVEEFLPTTHAAYLRTVGRERSKTEYYRKALELLQPTAQGHEQAQEQRDSSCARSSSPSSSCLPVTP